LGCLGSGPAPLGEPGPPARWPEGAVCLKTGAVVGSRSGAIGPRGGLKIILPLKSHKHLAEMQTQGVLLDGVRLGKDKITLIFELPEPKPVVDGVTVGIDVGQITTLSCSSGQKIEADPHGHSYQSICNTLARKKKGSKAFRKAVTHRTNFIGWSVNQLNLTNVKRVNIEDIKDLRKGKRNSRSLQHWNYKELFEKLEAHLVDAGVQINKVSPTYTSQRCSTCGWVRKGNRQSKCFKCDQCGFTHDADLNASINLSLALRPITKQQRLSQANRKGFYWLVIGEELIVPLTQKPPENKIP
jgi:IS605 OrfB family transposase